ncbi:hypothetical protein GQ457_15G004520 [Hibiscus cannabinus]
MKSKSETNIIKVFVRTSNDCLVNAEVWTHNNRATEETRTAITDPERLSGIKTLLCNVLKGSNKSSLAKTVVSRSVTHTERRLHQMMFADRDYERTGKDVLDERQRPNADVVNWYDKDYSVEYYIRHIDGSPVKSDAERQKYSSMSLRHRSGKE